MHKYTSKQRVIFACLALLGVFALLSPLIFYHPATGELNENGQKVSLEIVSTEAARQKGLSGRTSLAQNKGMIFVFDRAGHQCLWMKDMQFSLDMVFVNDHKQIIQIEPNVSPQTYPKSFCAADTRYVLELHDGEAAKLDLHTGQTLHF